MASPWRFLYKISHPLPRTLEAPAGIDVETAACIFCALLRIRAKAKVNPSMADFRKRSADRSFNRRESFTARYRSGILVSEDDIDNNHFLALKILVHQVAQLFDTRARWQAGEDIPQGILDELEIKRHVLSVRCLTLPVTRCWIPPAMFAFAMPERPNLN